MKRLVLAAALALMGAAPEPPQPLTFWWYASNGNEEKVRDALDCALERWRAATCIAIDVSHYAAHWVRAVPADMLDGRAGWTTGSSWNATRIRLLQSMTPESMCMVLTHEIGAHVLRRSNRHPALDTSSITYEPTSLLRSHITQEDIDLVCARQNCGCSSPENAP